MWLKPFTIYQPSYPAGINWGHPLAQGLVSFVIGNHQVPVDLVTGNPGISASGTPSARSYHAGSAIELGGTASTRYDFAYSPTYAALLTARTGWFSGQFSGTGVQALFGANADTPGSLYGTPMLLYTSIAGTQAAFIVADSSGNYSWWRSGVAFPTGRPTSFIVSQGAGDASAVTPKFWLDGSFATSPATDSSSASAGTITTDTKIRLGNRGGGGRQFIGLFAGGALWGRAFSPNELRAFGEAPYQIFRPSAWRSTPKTASSNVNVSPTGVAATGTAGSFGPSISSTLSGASATGTAGSLSPDVAPTLSGTSATGAAGDLTAQSDASLSGVAGTGSAGTVAPSVSNTGLGVSGTGSAGTMSAGGFFTGTSSTGAAGDFTPSVIVAAMGGVSGTATAGVLAASLSADGIGVAGTGGVGSLGASPGATLAGAAATGLAGVFSAIASATLTLTGVAGTGLAGTLLAVVGNLGSGKRRVTASLDVRRVSGIASRVNRATARDTRRLTSPQDD